MKYQTIKLVSFSPTGTTKAILNAIARGFNPGDLIKIDITRPEQRNHPLLLTTDDILLIGVPVYMGRVPDVLSTWLKTIHATNTPTICVVVYGNRVYDDALLELRDILISDGCLPIAAGAFIGEHSFSSCETPIAADRPDRSDLALAESFGRKIKNKLLTHPNPDPNCQIIPPGQIPYRGETTLWDVDFIDVSPACNSCQLCSSVCPTSAINPQDSRQIDHKKCITCCACIKKCPSQARSIKPGPVHDAASRLHRLFKEPKQPELYY